MANLIADTRLKDRQARSETWKVVAAVLAAAGTFFGAGGAVGALVTYLLTRGHV